MPPKTTKKPAGPPKNMEAFRDRLVKRYGTAVRRRDEVVEHDVIPTGSLTLDLAHRTGGWVVGRIHEILGPEGVGKTTLVISSMVEAQKKFPDKAVAYIDMEQTFDYPWAEANGLDTSDDRFLHIYPDDAEDVSDLLRQTADSGLVSMSVVDSIGGMESKEAFEKDAEDKVIGRNAQVITRMVKHCAVICRRNNVTALLVNQPRVAIGSMSTQDISAGPRAMKHSTTTKVVLSGTSDEPIKYLLDGDTEPVIIGRMVRARVVRSKVAVQGKKAEFLLFNADTREYGPVGINRADEAINIGVYTEVIEQKGGWYYLPGQKKGIQGRQSLLAHFNACPDDLEMVRALAVKTLSHEVTEEREVVLEHEGEDES